MKQLIMAGAIGIKKFHNRQDVWNKIHRLGDEQSFFVLERFVPGNIFHVDSIWFKGEMVYAVASAYGTPPLEVTQRGGIFTTRIIERGTELEDALTRLNRKMLK